MVKNLTPHPIVFEGIDGEITTIQPEPVPARVREVLTPKGIVIFNGVSIPRFTPSYGEVTGLPERKADIFYIVSNQVRQALPERGDLFSPCKYIRNEQGNVIAAEGVIYNKGGW